jgi:hypothetical protein
MNHPSPLVPDPLLRAFFANYTAILPSTSLPGISPVQLSGTPIPLEFVPPNRIFALPGLTPSPVDVPMDVY